MKKKTIVIIGAGPGISNSVAARFGREGYKVILIGRSEEKLANMVKELEELGTDTHFAIADVSNSSQLANALLLIKDIEILHYNASSPNNTFALDEQEGNLIYDFTVSVAGLLTSVKACLPELEKNKGSVLITGGGLAKYPHPDYASLLVGKAAQANLAESLSQALIAKGVFVGILQINGYVNNQDTVYNPPNIAEQFWKINTERAVFENIL